MGAPKGNQFWKLRSKHGRDKLFKTPKLLWEAACEYFQWCDDNPWQKTEATIGINKNDIKTIPTERPYTLSGLALYLNASSSYWREFRKNKNLSKDFLSIITRIEEIIYTQKFEGAAVGAFNSNIIARDLGLKEKSEIEQTNPKEPDLSNLSYEELLKLKEQDNSSSD
jgi:hypothetical protein